LGNILSKHPVRKIEQRQEGISTLGSRKIWYDDTVKRLNSDDHGVLLGDFSGADRILTFMQSGHFKLTSYDLATHFEEDMIIIRKYDPEQIYTAVYQENETKFYYVKRFKVEPTERKIDFLGDDDKNKLILITSDLYPHLGIQFDVKLKTRGVEQEEIPLHEFIGVKSYKAKGKRLTTHPVKKISLLEPALIEPLPQVAEEIKELQSQEQHIVKVEEKPEIKKEKEESKKKPGEKPRVKAIQKKQKIKSNKGDEKNEKQRTRKKIEPEGEEPVDSADTIQMELPL
jgi:topoisomerase-4 subunit A